MDKKQITEALKKAKESSPKRKFKQTVDLIVILQGIDLKKSDQNVNAFVNLHHPTGKKVSVCALTGPELRAQAKEVCDDVVSEDEFAKYKAKDAKKLAEKHDFFIAQATIMPKIASAFGKVFGPKGKMPNPKAGCVVPPNANLKPLYEKLQKVIKIQTTTQPVVQCKVGIEGQNDEEVVDNIITVYTNLKNTLPNGEHNIRKTLVKLTMGPSVMVGGKEKEASKEKASKKAKEVPKVEKKQEEKPKEEKKAKEKPKEVKKK